MASEDPFWLRYGIAGVAWLYSSPWIIIVAGACLLGFGIFRLSQAPAAETAAAKQSSRPEDVARIAALEEKIKALTSASSSARKAIAYEVAKPQLDILNQFSTVLADMSANLWEAQRTNTNATTARGTDIQALVKKYESTLGSDIAALRRIEVSYQGEYPSIVGIRMWSAATIPYWGRATTLLETIGKLGASTINDRELGTKIIEHRDFALWIDSVDKTLEWVVDRQQAVSKKRDEIVAGGVVGGPKQ